MAKVKAQKAPKEVKRNIPAIDISCVIFTILITIAMCVVMTYVCTWGSYYIQSEEDILTFQGMMKYVEKNINFMRSYIFCGIVLWGTIGFVISKLIIKLFKYIINYK